MKKLFVIIFLIGLASVVHPQEETLLNGELEHGGYIAPSVRFTNLNNEFAALAGGYIGWVVNHQYVLGAGGFGLTNKIKVSEVAQNTYNRGPQLYMNFAYGGGYLEYVWRPNDLVHLSASALIGGGELKYVEKVHRDDWEFDREDDMVASDAFFVVEPTINAEMNVTSFFRIDAGVSYRMITGLNLIGIKNSDLSGVSANLSFKFGRF
ncbi:MAG: hypothetical protein NTX22_14675 [Ignavibacteriales bacterium]|nr:hypothetical protein [Ignavibacteriales bacterium]